MKNVPIPSRNSYIKQMIYRVEAVFRKMRWKALFFDRKDCKPRQSDTYGFNTPIAPDQNPLLNAFESDVYNLISNMKFDPRRNDFQKKLSSDVKDLKNSNSVFVAADKTTNLYKMDKSAYDKLLKDNVTKSYKKTSDTKKQSIDREGKAIATNLRLIDRMEVMAERSPFVTIKDHKEDFMRRKPCRLINPAKTEIGIISKKILDSINTQLCEITGMLQWRSTQSAIDWFKNLTNKSDLRFIKFDIVEFYPSITLDVLNKALAYARSLIPTITDRDVNIILNARKSLLFSDNSPWVKKESGEFDVTMGSYDGAEICELVGLFLLSKLSSQFGKGNIGLYRDDGLMVTKSNARQSDKTRKDIIRLFKECGFGVTIEILLIVTDYLDVTFDLSSGKFWPYRKPNSEPLYINAKSNHPPCVIKQLPDSINSRLNSISCDKEVFDNAKPMYESALRASGFQSNLEYSSERKNQKRSRKRRVIWFNPPFNRCVKTHVANRFLSLIDKHFPKHHRYYQIFNRTNVKVSYSCTSNMAAIISSHNARVLSPEPTNDAPLCNCQTPSDCPLDNKCLTESVVYKASVSAPPNPVRHYYGLTEGAFKTRYTQHKNSFAHRKNMNKTELAKHVWDLKDNNVVYNIKWSIVQRAAPYKCGTRKCDVCLSEKMVIATSNPTTKLNTRAEIVSTCRHRAKFRYSKIPDSPD